MTNKTASFLRIMKSLAVCAALACVTYGPASAQEMDAEVVSVEINKGAMVKLSRPASSIVVSDPDTADVQVVSPKLVFVRGKKVGETSFYAIDSNDDPILSAIVDVTHNISNLQRAVKSAVPEADVRFKTVDGGLVMDGYAASVKESENISEIASTFVGSGDKMINMIKTNGSDQVMLRVKIVEMSRTNLKRLGVNLQHLTVNGDFGLQVLQGPDIGFYGADPNITYFRTFGSLLRRGSSTNTNVMFRYKDFASVLEAIETNGLATVLAEPTLTTTTGKPASFLAGGQYPLPVQGQNGTVTVQYQSFGVSLNFTPVVMSKNRMSITIAPEVSSLDFNNPITVANFTYPILNTRKASAVVELGSGDTFVLAGLLRNDGSTNINKFPGLGNVPVLGALFRSNAFQNNESELVILVTPYIVRPISDQQRAQTPMDGYTPPSDLQLLLQGQLYQQQPMERGKEMSELPRLHGDGGFILE